MVDEFSKKEELSVGVCTWNMGGVKPYEHIDLKDWLFNGVANTSEAPDIYVIGIQELVPLKASRLFSSNRNESDWTKNVVRKNLFTYAPQEEYQLVRDIDMAGL